MKYLYLTISGCPDPSITNVTAQITSATPPNPNPPHYSTAYESYFDMTCVGGYHLNREMYAFLEDGKFSIKYFFSGVPVYAELLAKNIQYHSSVHRNTQCSFSVHWACQCTRQILDRLWLAQHIRGGMFDIVYQI